MSNNMLAPCDQLLGLSSTKAPSLGAVLDIKAGVKVDICVGVESLMVEIREVLPREEEDGSKGANQQDELPGLRNGYHFAR